MLRIDELRSYDNWVGKNAQIILDSVYRHGGWDNVFPNNGDPFPLWLSRVRNFFNYYPNKLKILDLNEGKQRSKMANHYHDYPGVAADVFSLGSLPYANADSKAKAADALSEYVYLDNSGNYWYQMSPGATGFHFKDSWKDFNMKFKAIRSTARGQADLPIFKLISPDKAGGSYEIIIKNDNEISDNFYDIHKNLAQRSTIQTFNENSKFCTVKYDKYVTDYKYEGSYNYSETIKNGFSAHDFRDIKPHRTYPGFYVNPTFNALQQPLASRVFPPKDKHGWPVSPKLEDAAKMIQGWL